eukprot:TRINITY_DN3918_c0_g1_i15.p1 TRINITY_DN3918_c0_g1~~TRINITY_DN3918_c0_g1_i15.p1  ORF type:complete len:574 (-),score=151.05 TRINITY_DN3918_c0_g1_i15:508-2229(-)
MTMEISELDYRSPSQDPNLSLDERLKILYPFVKEEETPLPRSWSTKDKYNYIGLSQNNLRIHYKGCGKTHKDASSVRATYPIPASCGLYYFEVKIVSKGRDGYMGVGLCAQSVNMNRLPGWDKHSYGYHGDDGHSFCSSGQGQAYGPTFTTGDVVGCGINLIDGSCFFTKNGHHLGIAFNDLPPNLYPTVGLQTPGEMIDANFGQDPFLFDIEGEMIELRRRTRSVIRDLTWPNKYGDPQAVLRKMVSSYLVHHGYSQTAEAFARSTGEEISEELASMRNRQAIQRLVLQGKIGEAIALTQQLYPGLLRDNVELLFRLKVRQFIEMISGADTLELETAAAAANSTAANNSTANNSAANNTTANNKEEDGETRGNSDEAVASMDTDSGPHTEMLNNGNNISNGSCETPSECMDVDSRFMEDGESSSSSQEISQESNSNNISQQQQPHSNQQQQLDMKHSSILSSPTKFEALLKFGRSLQELAQQVDQDHVSLLQDAFSLLAYADPWTSSVSDQLNPTGRESVCHSLNSAILESKNQPGRPPLEIAMAHSKQLIKVMANKDLGACAFADTQIFNQ